MLIEYFSIDAQLQPYLIYNLLQVTNYTIQSGKKNHINWQSKHANNIELLLIFVLHHFIIYDFFNNFCRLVAAAKLNQRKEKKN